MKPSRETIEMLKDLLLMMVGISASVLSAGGTLILLWYVAKKVGLGVP